MNFLVFFRKLWFSVEVIQTDNYIPQCEHKLGKLKWLDNRGSSLRIEIKSEQASRRIERKTNSSDTRNPNRSKHISKTTMSKEINVGLQSLVLNQPENSNGLVGITLSATNFFSKNRIGK